MLWSILIITNITNVIVIHVGNWNDIALIKQLVCYLESLLCILLVSPQEIWYHIKLLNRYLYMFVPIILVERAQMLSSNIASENVILLPDFGVAGDTMVLGNMSNNRLKNSIIQHGVQIDIIMQILMILSLVFSDATVSEWG